MKPGRNALAASRSLMPASRSSLTSRSCKVAWARSTRPLAWLELAHRISMLSSDSARPNWVMPWPCCMDQGCGRNAPYPVLGSCDADGLRASQLQHAVQDRDADVHLGCLTLVRARAQPVPDHPFEAADCGLGQGT